MSEIEDTRIEDKRYNALAHFLHDQFWVHDHDVVSAVNESADAEVLDYLINDYREKARLVEMMYETLKELCQTPVFKKVEDSCDGEVDLDLAIPIIFDYRKRANVAEELRDALKPYSARTSLFQALVACCAEHPEIECPECLRPRKKHRRQNTPAPAYSARMDGV